jgi:SAM-dependent methyltransferase
MTSATDRWVGGDAYEGYVGRWSRLVAAEFVDWLAVAPASSWVDVGCGTGALTETILRQAAPVAVTGVDPSASFIREARARVADPRSTFADASADSIPLASGSVDAAVAGLVLNFVPDVAAALAEMRRVVRAGGTVAGYVWDYAGRMELMRLFWDAAIALDPAAAAAHEGSRFPLCAPEPLRAAFEAAGLDHVDVRPIDVPTVFTDFDDYWSPFLSGIAPAPGYAMSLDEAGRVALRERLRATLPTDAGGAIRLTARAWAVRGRSG